jgi:hypothetical protein
MDLPMHQSAPKEVMISIIYIRYLDIAVKKYSIMQLRCMGLGPPVILIHVNNVLSQRHNRKNVNKNWLGSGNLPAERLYVDISSIKEISIDGAKFWALIVDDYTDYCWSFVLMNKSDLKVKIKTLLTDLKITNRNVRFIRCDDSGENMTMKK